MTKTTTHAGRSGRTPAVAVRQSVAVHYLPGQVRTGGRTLPVEARVPVAAQPSAGWVILARQASGALSPQEAALLDALHRAGLATLTAGLLTPVETLSPAALFDTPWLGVRLVAMTRWLAAHSFGRGRRVGYVASGPVAAAALWAAAELRGQVAGVVSLGGRADLAAPRLAEVTAPVMLVVNRRDRLVLGANQAAHRQLNPDSRLVVAPSFRYLRYWLTEPSALDRLLAREWLALHLLGQHLPPEQPRLLDFLPRLNLPGRAAAAATVLALMASLAGPPQPAEAAGSIGVSSGTLTFTAGAGETNTLTVQYYNFIGFETGYVINDSTTAITAGTGCSQLDANTVQCVAISFPSVFITSVVINANDANDTITIESLGNATTVNAGTGLDTLNVLTTGAALTLNTDAGNDTVNLGTAAPATNGSMTSLNATVTVNGGDNDVLNLGDAGSSTPVSAVLTLSGGARQVNTSQYVVSLTGAAMGGGINYYLGSGLDIVVVNSTQTGEPLRVYGNGASDIIGIGNGDVRNIDGPVHVGTSSGDIAILVDNSNDPTSYNNISFSPTALTGLAGASITYDELEIRASTLNAGTGADTITLTGFWDNFTVPGDQAPRQVNGGGGADTFRIGTDLSLNGGSLNGGSGSDTISYELWSSGIVVDLGLQIGTNIASMSAVDNATGGSGNDALVGYAGNNVLNGGGGSADTVASSGDFDFWLFNNELQRLGVDTDTLLNVEDVSLVGGSGGRTLNAYNQNLYRVTLRGGAGNDWLVGGPLNDSVDGGLDHDTVMGSWGDDTILGGSGLDVLREANNFATLNLFNTSMTGSTGTDQILGPFIGVSVEGDAGGQFVNLHNWTLSPTSVYGAGGDDTVRLGSGNFNDLVEGGAHSAGDRVEQVDVRSAIMTSNVLLQTLDSGNNTNGIDTILNVEGLVFTGTATTDFLDAAFFPGGPVSLYGVGGDDWLSGSAFNDLLDGGSGSDTIYGNNGDDTVTGGDGSDTVDGGNNTDTLLLDVGNLNVTLTGNSINDSGSTQDQVDNVEQLVVTGGPNGQLFDAGGFGGLVTLLGVGGNDTLIAGTGGGSLDGGAGTADLLAAQDNNGLSLTNSALNKGGVNFAVSGFELASLTGGTNADVINASSFSGSVTLDGQGANDTLTGGNANDSLLGGDGHDSLVGNGGHDTAEGGAGSDTVSAGDGNDSVLGGSDDDQLFGGTGTNTLRGEAGNDALVGGDGNDSLVGGTENDTLTAGLGTNTIDGGGGTDRLVENLSGLTGPFSLTLTSSLLNLSGGATASGLVSDIELAHLTGSNQADTLDASGFAGQVTLLGGGGNDELSGAQGNDSLDGGAGSDVASFQVGNNSVTLTGSALEGQGNDTLVSIEGYRITGGAAGQTLDASAFQPPSGDQGVTLDGAGGADLLIGSDYRDSLIGGSGNDTLIGNGLADTLAGGAGSEDVVAAAGPGPYTLTNTSLGIDTVTDVLTQTEAAVITGSINADFINAWDFTGRVTLVGDAGSDVLQVGTGGGSLVGGSGSDSLRVRGDTDYNLSDTNLDLPALGQTYALSSTETVSITAGALANTLDASAYTGNVTLMGEGGADTVRGGQGNDVVQGGLGNDQVSGGPGADTLDGGDHTTFDLWVESGAVTVTLVALGQPSLPIDTVSGLEQASFTGDASPNIFNLIGFTGTATLRGGGGDDFLTGGEMADELLGEAGNDTLTGNAAFDTLNGGLGTDRLVAFGAGELSLADDRLEGAGPATDTLSSIDEAILTSSGGSSIFDASAFSFPVTLLGGDSPDTLIGGLSADSIIGNGGDDSLEGRGGNDTLSGLAGNDFMDGGTENDLLNGYLGNDTLQGGDGNDTLIGAEGSDSVVGGDGNDLLSHTFDVLTTTVGITMDDTLRGGPGLDTLEGGVGFDVVQEIGDTGYMLTNASLQSTLGNDALSGFEAASLVGGNSGNLFHTLAFTGPVTLDGQAGDDTFLAGGQNDSLVGGDGTGDLLHAAGDLNFTLSDTLLTGLGTDSLSLVERAIITGGVGNNHLNAGAFTLGPVTLTGGAGNDTLAGGAGSDSLDAGEGDDTLTGNAGTNTLLGGAGTNTLIETSDVHYTLTNSLLVGDTTVPGASLTSVLSNTTLAQLSGGANPNLINASAFTGTVTLDGGAGADTVLGGLGDDCLRGGADDDLVVAAADVSFTLTNTLLSGLGADSLDSFERASLTGGSGNNHLNAGAFTLGPVTLTGQDGNDTLVGGSHGDSLDGGAGDEVLTGGDGDDLFLGGAGSDTVDDSVSGAGTFVVTPTLLTGRGTDTLNGIEGVRLTGGSAGNLLNAQAANVRVTLIGGPGNDTLIGSALADSLNGGADDDMLTGGAGEDTLEAGAGNADLLVETINANVLVLTSSSLNADFFGVPNGLVGDSLVGGQFERASLTGGGLDNLIDSTGFNGTATLIGLGGNDTLRGGLLADSLDGGAGTDLLEGFNGNDTLRGGAANDTLLGGEGHNLLEGEDGNDSLLGGTGNDTLHGGLGNDTLTGLAGNDSLHGQAGTDLLVEVVSGQLVITDTLMTGLGTDTLASLELVQITGSGVNDTLDASAYTVGTLTLIGLGGDDVLRGGALADSLLGGDGNDSLSGNAGNDTLDGGAGTDWAVETASGLLVLTDGGLVTPQGSDLHLSVERASLSGGSGNDTLDASAYTLNPVILSGGDGADSLIGTALNDSLFGDGGDDFLDGRQGNDSLTGGAGTDAAVAVGDVNFIVTATSLTGNGTDTLTPSVESVNLTGGASANTFNLLAWPGSGSILGGGGTDLLQVGGSQADDNFLLEAARVINGALTVGHDAVEHLVVDAAGGDDTLVIHDSLSTAVAADGTVVAAPSLTHVTLAGGAGDDLAHFKPMPVLLVHVDGGPHAAGDTLEFDGSTIVVQQQEGLLLPEGYQPVTHVNVEFIDLLRNWINQVFIPFLRR